MSALYEGVALHHHRQYEKGCAEVLTEEWARSTAARLSMLEKSNDDLPYSIALLEKKSLDDTNDVDPKRISIRVVGHSRLCRVHNQSHAAFVESVVISKELRGRGLGRKLMLETERHAESLYIDTLYLTTHDKVDFYRRIGYELCSPVISLGSASRLLSGDKFAKLLSKITISDGETTEESNRITSAAFSRNTTDLSEGIDDITVMCTVPTGCSDEQTGPPPPPPSLLPPNYVHLPPPLAPLLPPLAPLRPNAGCMKLNTTSTPVTAVWMKKHLIIMNKE